MRFTNIEERKKQRTTFLLLYTGTIILLVLIGAAFFSRGPATKVNATVVQVLPSEVVPAVVQEQVQELPTTDTSVIEAPAADSQRQIDSLIAEVKERDRQIIKLRDRKVVVTQKAAPVADRSAAEEVKFLRWALSSQTADISKMKKENASLKARLNDLQRK